MLSLKASTKISSPTFQYFEWFLKNFQKCVFFSQHSCIPFWLLWKIPDFQQQKSLTFVKIYYKQTIILVTKRAKLCIFCNKYSWKLKVLNCGSIVVQI